MGLAATLAFAGTTKLLDPAPFERVLRQSGLPSRVADAAATGLPRLELLLARSPALAAPRFGGRSPRWPRCSSSSAPGCSSHAFAAWTSHAVASAPGAS